MRMRSIVYYTLFISSCSACLPRRTQRQFPSLRVRDEWMVDDGGRVRLFHGFNAVHKGEPWIPTNLLNQTRLRYFQEWGFNVVRLGTMWSGVYPREGYRNDTYLGIINQIIGNLASHGMYALLDMHQDGLTSLYGSYDGAPFWLIKKFPKPRVPYPLPFDKITFWEYVYLTDATGEAFQNLYNNVSKSMDYWSQFWQTVATKLGKQNKNILGYELINEPWAGDVYANPLLLLPGNAGSENLQRIYETLAAAIRKVDDDTLIFYEPVTWGMLLNGTYFGSGFRHVPGGEAYRDRSVFSFHYYCWLMSSAVHKPYPSARRYACDDVLGPEVFNAVKSDIAKFGGSSFLTEFGTCAPDGQKNSTTTIECDFVMAEADRNFQSWTYWDSVFFDKSGNVIWDTVRGFSRAYAQAISGTPKLMMFNTTTADFHLWYHLDVAIDSPTEIVAPPVHYPKGVLVSLSAGLSWSWDANHHIVLVKRTSYFMQDKSLVKVHLSPKP